MSRASQEGVKPVDANMVAEEAFGDDQKNVKIGGSNESEDAQGHDEKMTNETKGLFRPLTHTRTRCSDENC